MYNVMDKRINVVIYRAACQFKSSHGSCNSCWQQQHLQWHLWSKWSWQQCCLNPINHYLTLTRRLLAQRQYNAHSVIMTSNEHQNGHDTGWLGIPGHGVGIREVCCSNFRNHRDRNVRGLGKKDLSLLCLTSRMTVTSVRLTPWMSCCMRSKINDCIWQTSQPFASD